MARLWNAWETTSAIFRFYFTRSWRPPNSHDLVLAPGLPPCSLRSSFLMLLELSLSSLALLVSLIFFTWYLIMPSFFSRPIDFTGKVSFNNTTNTFKSAHAGSWADMAAILLALLCHWRIFRFGLSIGRGTCQTRSGYHHCCSRCQETGRCGDANQACELQEGYLLINRLSNQFLCATSRRLRVAQAQSTKRSSTSPATYHNSKHPPRPMRNRSGCILVGFRITSSSALELVGLVISSK
jgi:hypothetical protein